MNKDIFKIVSCGASDIGLVRKTNEDVWVQLPEIKLYILADGMGGHVAGEVAAERSAFALSAYLKSRLKGDEFTFRHLTTWIKNGIKKTNEYIHYLGRKKKSWRGMGTTLCCMLFHEGGIVFANVGDSRIYRFRKGVLKQLSIDHSLEQELHDLGGFTEADIASFEVNNVITQAVGISSLINPSIYASEVLENDIYLMCSDGLSDYVPLNEIESTLINCPDLEESLKHLILLANGKGGQDNVTVVLAKACK